MIYDRAPFAQMGNLHFFCRVLVVCSIIEAKSSFYILLYSSVSESLPMLTLTRVSVGWLSLPLVHRHKKLAMPMNIDKRNSP